MGVVGPCFIAVLLFRHAYALCSNQYLNATTTSQLFSYKFYTNNEFCVINIAPSNFLNSSQFFLEIIWATFDIKGKLPDCKEDYVEVNLTSTHLVLYRYTRLNFGTNASAELFQHTLQQHLQGMAGVQNIADDILVFGSTRQEHDQALENCLKRLKEKGLTLNKSKCSFLNTELEFFGQIFLEQGTRPDPRRTQDVIDAAIPQNVSELRSFLGMVTFSSKYIANFATIATPLRELTKTGVTFTWEQKHQTAFDKLKAAITKPPVMAYFDAKKDTVLTVDASPVGLSGILSQRSACDAEGKVVAYASRALSDVERRYSQTEKEALSIVWALEHFHLYLYGHSFTLETDHKPLEMIYGRANSKPCARIERWVLRLQPYNVQVKYKPGPTNQADFLSRHPSTSNTGKQSKIADEYVHFIVQNAVPKSMTLSEIREETDKDRVLKALRAAIRLNRWDADTVPPSELLFNRTVRGALPTLKPRTIVNRHKEAKDNEQKRCIYNKTYADLHRNAKESSIKVGDTVLVQQEKKQKLMPKFNTTPYKVIARKGTTVVAENKERHRITRNVSHFKQIPDVNEMDYSSEEERNNEPEPACEYRRSNRTRRAPVRYGHGLSY
eukprot:gene15818-7127_t